MANFSSLIVYSLLDLFLHRSPIMMSTFRIYDVKLNCEEVYVFLFSKR